MGTPAYKPVGTAPKPAKPVYKPPAPVPYSAHVAPLKPLGFAYDKKVTFASPITTHVTTKTYVSKEQPNTKGA